MKKQFLLLIFMIVQAGSFAQSVCNVYIEPSFDSECVLTDYEGKPDLIMTKSDCNFVCKNSTVTYTAKGTSGNYTWTIWGADSYSAQGNIVTVHWGNNTSGKVILEVETNGSVCSAELCVVIIDSPQVGATSVPNYYYDASGKKVIEICLGQTISFTDNSTVTGTSPITGYRWDSGYGSVLTPNYEITPSQGGNFTIKHNIINSCGCSDIEYYDVIVSETDLQFELSCYGTACAGSTHTYTLIEPYCSTYKWSVESGEILPYPGGQGKPQITVKWDNTPLGYGVISLDLSECEETRCPANSIRIPIISDNVEITGPELVCVNEYVVYDVTLWGSTEYKWSITPQNGGLHQQTYKNANSQLVSFEKSGTYEITVEYNNDFLPCGTFNSLTKTVVVKERLEIAPENSRICEGETKTFTTNMPQPSTWRIYNNFNQLVYTYTGVSLTRTFSTAGKYKVIADNVDACNTATTTITVAPLPPSLLPIAISGPNTACPETSITLSAIPTNSMYDIVWEPVCQGGKKIAGNNASIEYGSVVCDVKVYQLDKTTGCLSEPTIHPVAPFAPAPFNYTSLTVCAGQTLYLHVSDQKEVIYNWTITPTEAASVKGYATQSSVQILINRLAGYSTPYPITVQLKREFCGIEMYDTVTLNVNDIETPIVSYSPDPVCQNTPVTFTTNGGAGTYLWSFNGGALTSNSTVTFTSHGTNSYKLSYIPVIGCDTMVVQGTIYVNPTPNGKITPLTIGTDLHFGISKQDGVSYQWKKNNNILPGEVNNTINVVLNGYGEYCCTVTFNATGCNTVVCADYEPDTIIPQCIPILLSDVLIDCNTYNIEAIPPHSAPLNWSISPKYFDNFDNSITPNSNEATAIFVIPGNFYVNAYENNSGVCYTGSKEIRIDYVLDMDIEVKCDTLIVRDYSLSHPDPNYVIPTRIVTVTDGSGFTSIKQLTSTHIETFSLPVVTVPTTYTVSMTIGNCTITKTFTQYPLPVITDISVQNPYCEKTPLLFNITGTNISKVVWNFGDGSSFSNSGTSVYHTYNYRQALYTLTVTAYNGNGCYTTFTKDSIQINEHNVAGEISILGQKICMGKQQTIRWVTHNPIFDYEWSTPPVYSGYQHYVYQSGDYSVTAKSPLGCVCQKMTNVPFYHSPTAKIVGETSYCFGEPVALYGYTGENGATYKWTITGPQSYSFISPNIEFAPAYAGTYNVKLTVSNAHCDSTTQVNVTVHPISIAPVLVPVSNTCIHQSSVCLRASDGRDLYWSNGSYGQTACFYTEGLVTARYIDQNGCYSKYGEYLICPKPNFDALLTGCYEKCDGIYDLPVYRFMPQTWGYCQSTYDWWYNGNIQSGGFTNGVEHLPVFSQGEHYMTVYYGGNCVVTSPTLTIEIPKPCCQGEYHEKEVNCYIKDGKLFYDITVTVCNKISDKIFIFDELLVNDGYIIHDWGHNPLFLHPGQCEDIKITVEANSFTLSSALFTLTGKGSPCNLDFSIILDPKECMCDNETNILENRCHIENGKLFYDILVEICNTGEQQLNLDNLMENNGYTIHNWDPKPNMFLNPGECQHLHITIEANDFSKISAHFTMFNKELGCFIEFSVILDPKECICSNETNIHKNRCYIENGKLFYDISVKICNTGEQQLNLDNLMENNGYTIHNWAPQQIFLDPGKCQYLDITIEANDFSKTSAYFTMFHYELGCFIEFSAPLDPKECICDSEVKIHKKNCYTKKGKLFFDIIVEICNTGTEPLYLDSLMVSSGYVIDYWGDQPLTLHTGECAKLNINVEVDDFSQTSALFTMFSRNDCFILFSVPLDPKECMCDSKVKTLIVNCYQNECKLFYDITVEICNTGTNDLNLENLIVGSGYTIYNWNPQPLILQPGKCAKLNITIEVNDFSQTSAFFTLFDEKNGCYIGFSVNLLDFKKCIEECEKIDIISIKFDDRLSTPQTVYFDFGLKLPGGTTDLLSLWVEPPKILNYNYYPPQNVDGTFEFDRNYLEQMAAKDEKVCVYAVVCIDSSYLCLTKICISARELLKSIKGTSPMPAPPNMLPEKESENTIAHSISIYPNPTNYELKITNYGCIIEKVEICDLIGKTIRSLSGAEGKFVNSINVSTLPQGMYLIKIYTDNGIAVKKFIKK